MSTTETKTLGKREFTKKVNDLKKAIEAATRIFTEVGKIEEGYTTTVTIEKGDVELNRATLKKILDTLYNKIDELGDDFRESRSRPNRRKSSPDVRGSSTFDYPVKITDQAVEFLKNFVVGPYGEDLEIPDSEALNAGILSRNIMQKLLYIYVLYNGLQDYEIDGKISSGLIRVDENLSHYFGDILKTKVRLNLLNSKNEKQKKAAGGASYLANANSIPKYIRLADLQSIAQTTSLPAEEREQWQAAIDEFHETATAVKDALKSAEGVTEEATE